jgi:hypothetical protein
MKTRKFPVLKQPEKGDHITNFLNAIIMNVDIILFTENGVLKC